MAKTRRDKYDLLTLATKGVLIGTDIVFEDENGDEVIKEVADYYFSLPTMEIHLKFTDGEGDVLNLKRTYVVEIDSGYNTVYKKRKRNRTKRNDN